MMCTRWMDSCPLPIHDVHPRMDSCPLPIHGVHLLDGLLPPAHR